MPSIRQSIRSSTASKRPTSAIADGQIALNTASGTPGIFFKDNANNIIKAGPAHYGASAPNSSPAVGGSTGNSIGEAWLDSSLTPAGWKIWNGSAWVNATPLSSDTVQGLVELATNAETQAGVDAARAVTAASLQSKVSDSISTTSASGIASSTAVKTAYDLANAALPKSGGIVTGNLEIGSTGSFTFEGATADGFETTLAVVDPTADRTITFPNVTGTVITTGDTGTVTGTMIADGTIVNAEISNTAAIAFSKLASLSSANIIVGNASGVPSGVAMTGDVTITNAGVTAIASNVIVNADVSSSAAIAYSKLALSSGITNTDVSASAAIVYSKLALSNSIVNADINTAAAIAGTKISPDFGSQNLATTGNITTTNHIAASGTATTPSIQVGNGTTYKPGLYSPGIDQVAISTNGTGRLFVDSSGRSAMGTGSPEAGCILTLQESASLNTAIALKNRNSTQTWKVVVDASAVDDKMLAFIDNTTSTVRMALTDAGRMGIGTTSPTQTLHVENTNLTNPSLTWGASATQTIRVSGIRELALGVTGAAPYDCYLQARNNASAAQALLLNPAGGNVGIGTTGPNAALDVRSATTWIGDGTTDAFLQFNQSATAANRWHIGTGTSNALIFYKGTYGSGSETARIDSSGRLLVGTSSYDGNARAVIQGNTSSNTTGALAVRYNGTRPTSAGEGIGAIRFESTSNTSSNYHYASISCDTDGTSSSDTDIPGRLVFSTTADGAASPTERLRINNAGLVAINTTAKLDSSNVSLAVKGIYPAVPIEVQQDGVTSHYSITFRNGNGLVGSITTSGSATAFNTSSDYRLKENIVPLNDAIDRINDLQVRRFNFKADPNHTVDGFIAHEAQAVVPECVTGTKDEVDDDGNPVYQGIDQSKLVPLLTAALQEAIAKIEALETRLSALEAA